jgi:hypothetical protein
MSDVLCLAYGTDSWFQFPVCWVFLITVFVVAFGTIKFLTLHLFKCFVSCFIDVWECEKCEEGQICVSIWQLSSITHCQNVFQEVKHMRYQSCETQCRKFQSFDWSVIVRMQYMKHRIYVQVNVKILVKRINCTCSHTSWLQTRTVVTMW